MTTWLTLLAHTNYLYHAQIPQAQKKHRAFQLDAGRPGTTGRQRAQRSAGTLELQTISKAWGFLFPIGFV